MESGHEILSSGIVFDRGFSVEFKKETARHMPEEGLSDAELADKLGAAGNLLFRSKSEHIGELEAEAKPGQASPRDLTVENEELRKTERMHEILKERWATSRRRNDVSIHRRQFRRGHSNGSWTSPSRSALALPCKILWKLRLSYDSQLRSRGRNRLWTRPNFAANAGEGH